MTQTVFNLLQEFSFDDTVESMVVESEDQPATSSEDNIVYNSHATWSLITDAMDMAAEDILTPPPEKSPKEHYCASTSPAEYVRGSSLEDSPLSSTSDREIGALKEEEEQEEEDASSQQTTHSDRESSESSDEDGSAEENSIPNNVKLPQSKFFVIPTPLFCHKNVAFARVCTRRLNDICMHAYLKYAAKKSQSYNQFR